jgi:hypothetical protein
MDGDPEAETGVMVVNGVREFSAVQLFPQILYPPVWWILYVNNSSIFQSFHRKFPLIKLHSNAQ